MSKAKSAIPEGFRSLTQYLIVTDADKFLAFIQNALGARGKFSMRDDKRKIRHAEAFLGESIIEFAQANDQWPALQAGLHYYVRNSDEVYARALRAGGESLCEPGDRDYGDREASIRDPGGNLWFISTHLGKNGYIPEMLQDLNSFFSVKDSASFLVFLQGAFAAEVVENNAGRDGSISHAKVRIGNTRWN